MRRYLVVANQTLGGENLREKIKSVMAEALCRFHLVVPASEPRWFEGEARALASRRLEGALAALEEMGAEVTGEVGDASPVQAIVDVLLVDGAFDEIILSTLPPGASRWLRQDLVHRVQRMFDLPCTHVVASGERVKAG